MQQVTDPHLERLRALAIALMDNRADWRAGIGGLIREIEDREPGFIQRIAADDQLKRLGVCPRRFQ